MICSYSEYKLNKKEKLIFVFAIAFIFLIIGELFYNTLIIMPFALPIYFKLKGPLESELLERRKKLLVSEFKDVMYSFSSTFSVGGSMKEAIEQAKLSLNKIYGKKSMMMDELSMFSREIEETRGSDTAIWEDFAKRSQIEEVRQFAGVYKNMRMTGGDLVKAIGEISNIITDKITLESEIKSIVAQKKFEGRIIGVMPVFVILFLRSTSASYLSIMYDTWIGRMIMTLCLGLTVGAVLIAERITDIEI